MPVHLINNIFSTCQVQLNTINITHAGGSANWSLQVAELCYIGAQMPRVLAWAEHTLSGMTRDV